MAEFYICKKPDEHNGADPCWPCVEKRIADLEQKLTDLRTAAIDYVEMHAPLGATTVRLREAVAIRAEIERSRQ